MPASLIERLPGGYGLLAFGVATRRRLKSLWRGGPIYKLFTAGPKVEGLAAQPRDFRPPDPENGRRILAGGFVLAGETLAMGPRGDPWDRPSPSRRFATALHGFGWLRDLTALGEVGAIEGLRLTLDWRRLFAKGNAFAWSPDILERRTFNLACAARTLCAQASEVETLRISGDLARQARALLAVDAGPLRAAERAAAAAVAGAALGGRAGEALLSRALDRLDRALPFAVHPDGGHTSRSPQAALELLYDLTTLDDALVQRGLAAPEEMMRALDRLSGAVRFFTLADGRLAAFQGGEELSAPYIAAARAQDDLQSRPTPGVRNGYHRLETRSLQVVADAAPPGDSGWSEAACAQPLAIEVLAGTRRLIVNSGWTPQAGPQAMRLVDAASTLSAGEHACGEPLSGYPAEILGPRLQDAYERVESQRHETSAALWLDLAHDGWTDGLGLRHERRLYLDIAADELRGEDRLVPAASRGPGAGRRFVAFAVRFHLHPQVSALVARDQTSVLLKAEGEETGWWLRSDAPDVMLEPSSYYHGGELRRSTQIVLRGQARLDAGARIRWKLSAATQSRVDELDGED